MATKKKAILKKGSAPRRVAGSKAVPGGEAKAVEKKFSAVSREMKSKERDLARLLEEAQRRAKAQLETDEAIRRLTTERDALQGMLKSLETQRTAAANERAAADRDLEEAEAVWSTFVKRAKTNHSFSSIKAVVSAVDGHLDELRTKTAALEKKAAEAESSATAARAALALAEKERRDAQQAIEKLPNEIRAARGQLSRVLAELRSTDPSDARRVAMAERDVRAAIEALRAQSRDGRETGLMHALLDTSPVEKARARLEAETRALNEIKTRLAETQAALQDRMQKRANEVATRIRQRPVANA